MSSSTDAAVLEPLRYLDARLRAFAVLRPLDMLMPHTVSAADGVPLAAFSAGDPKQPTVLVVNALGVSAAFIAPLVARLACDFHVITWESRGLPDMRVDVSDLSLARHARDAADVLTAFAGHEGRSYDRPRVATLVAYCSGSNVAAYALDERMLNADRLALVSPSMEIAGVTDKTPYQKAVLPLWDKVAQAGTAYATMVRVLVNQTRRADDGSLDYQLATLNALPFDDNESIWRYARMQAMCLREDWAARLGRLALPALVVHGTRDDVIHAATSRAVAAALPAARFDTIDDAGHFGVYTSRTLHERIAAFLAGATCAGRLRADSGVRFQYKE